MSHYKLAIARLWNGEAQEGSSMLSEEAVGTGTALALDGGRENG